jgi:hypothetical protein
MGKVQLGITENQFRVADAELRDDASCRSTQGYTPQSGRFAHETGQRQWKVLEARDSPSAGPPGTSATLMELTRFHGG